MNYSKKRQNKTQHKFRKVLYASTVSLCCFLAGNTALAQRDQSDAGKEYNIPPSNMSEALQAFSEQSDAEIIYAEKDVAEKTTKGVEGEYSREQALEELIGDSGLVYEVSSDGVIIIRTAFLDVKQAGAAQQFRVAQADQGVSQSVETIDASETDDSSQDENADRDIILVTGTNIRGIAPESSPVKSFDFEDIQRSGAATAQDFLQLLPQNFGGGSNIATTAGLPNNNDASANVGFGAGVNLRGLGSGSTLILLNGRRIAPSSGLGDFVDISMIPASAIERVDILTDGASSIYGADAVAGVVNFILRDDFDGAEISYRYGTVTDGSLTERRASASVGEAWSTGNALASYEYYSRGNLGVEERSFSSSAAQPQDLLPSQTRHSVLVSGAQALTNNLSFSADFLFTTRDSTRVSTLISGDLNVAHSSSENISITGGATWDVAEEWTITAAGTFSDLSIDFESFGDNPFQRVIDTSISSVDVSGSGPVFMLPGGDVQVALGGHFRSEQLTNENLTTGVFGREADRTVYAAYGELFVPVFSDSNALPGIERLELNVSGRFSDFSDFGSTANPKVGLLWAPIESVSFRGSYSTSFNPPALGIVGADDRAAIAYPTSLINSILGLTPGNSSIADVVGLSVVGTADQLDAESSRTFTAGVDYQKTVGRHNFSASLTWFDIEFEDRLGRTPIPGNAISFDAPNIAVANPGAFPPGTVVFDPTTEQIGNALADLSAPVSQLAGADPLDAAFINFVGITRNLSLSFVSGIDFDVRYQIDNTLGDWTFGASGTYLSDFDQQASVSTPVVSQLNTQFNPVDLRLRGEVSYSRGGFTASTFVNFVNSYRVDDTSPSDDIEAWTTVDLSIAYNLQESAAPPILQNSAVRLSVINLFDEDPPATPGAQSFEIFGYDPTNASPLGRFLAIEFTKRF